MEDNILVPLKLFTINPQNCIATTSMSQPQGNVGPVFDPGQNLPPTLQARIDSWDNQGDRQGEPPRRQFQQYGPLNAYLQGHKFTSERFLVKPQKLLRRSVNESEETSSDESGGSEDERFSRTSLDSTGEEVSNKNNSKAYYPDFSIEEFWGADNDDNPNPDEPRVIIEVASLSRMDKMTENQKITFRRSVIDKVIMYLERASGRTNKSILGVGILGNMVTLHSIIQGRQARKALNNAGDWISLYDPRFVTKLNQACAL